MLQMTEFPSFLWLNNIVCVCVCDISHYLYPFYISGHLSCFHVLQSLCLKYVKVWKILKSLGRGRENVRTFLYTIVQNFKGRNKVREGVGTYPYPSPTDTCISTAGK